MFGRAKDGTGGLPVLAVLLLTWSPVAHAQTADPIVVQVGDGVGGPGRPAVVRLMLFTPEKGEPIKKIVQAISFSEPFIRFLSAKAGPAAEGAVVETEVEQEERLTRVALEIVFETPPESGTLAELSFEISEGAPIGKDVPLQARCEVGNQQGTSLSASCKDGTIRLVDLGGVIIACFFYLH